MALDLALHVGDAGLQRPAVEGAGGDVVALGADEVGDLQLAGAGGGAHDDVGEEGAEDEVHVLGGELLHHLGAALGVGAVVLEDDLDRAAVDAAGFVEDLERGLGGALVPAAVGGADAGAVELEAEADRLRRSAPGRSPGARGEGAGGGQSLEHAAAAGGGHGFGPPAGSSPFAAEHVAAGAKSLWASGGCGVGMGAVAARRSVP